MPPPYGPAEPMPDLTNKIILITGGGSGIGLAFAQHCLRLSARVVIGDINLTQDAKSTLDAAGSAKAVYRRCDVTSWADLHDLISASVGAFGDVPDVYAPVAGIFEPGWSNFWDEGMVEGHPDYEGGYRTMRINVDHPIHLTRLALKALAGANKQGVVCLVASTAAIRAGYLFSLYSASKWAIRGFAKSMAQADVEEGVRVVCVMPGLVDSPLWRDRQDKIMEWAKYDMRRGLMPKDIAEVMVKMVRDEGGWCSGGTCVLKTVDEERVFEKGWREREKEYDPSPRPDADLTRVRNALDGERGKGWKRREGMVA
ncbi:2,5-dichloro-2,5-cyclohexadiene-1,4-diol dehydrogenase [Cyphellophora attinorum]|uniref:2,5-dichloro-2,5-cyclohexadiene-1,4-diol dehydrogenase n=1 Tax=Cyphellophora attinorum TaxID=1664694 RepID=A0A0N1HGP2_9EURO|nr:2,5-dichloro-2,5-cyclohexadiene-1,4-diol dehydrogenase [Phialophora attinorum]KPI34656.1 2,5-dichloro-2,5-cyclohexadiene-1,4-diol dehydrogenase [Phialophora attinorum]